MNPLPRLMLPAFLLVACGTGLVPLPRMPTVSISIPDSRLTIGSRFTFTAAVDISSSLYVFVVDPEGRVDQLLPNRTAAGSPVAPALRVNANQVIAFPPADARFTVETEPPLGQYTVLAFASAQALNLAAISAYATADAQFADGKMTGLDALSAALKVAADAQPGNLYSEARVPLTITP